MRALLHHYHADGLALVAIGLEAVPSRSLVAAVVLDTGLGIARHIPLPETPRLWAAVVGNTA